MSLELTAPTTFERQRKLTLQEELSGIGVKTIDEGIVKKHMRDTISKHRVGIYRFTGPMLYTFTCALNWLCRRSNFRKSFYSTVALFAVLMMLSSLGVPYTGATLFALVVFVVGFFAALIVFLNFINTKSARYNEAFANASEIWIREPITTVSVDELRAYSAPEHLHERAIRANRLSDVSVSRVRFGPDPLLEISRKRALFMERAYIGGWDTGVPSIDNF